MSAAFQWLNDHTPKESVILGDPVFTNSYIPIYTHNNVYVAVHAQFYGVPSIEEIRKRLYNYLHLMGIVSQDDFDQYIHNTWMANLLVFEEYCNTLNKNMYVSMFKVFDSAFLKMPIKWAKSENSLKK